MGILPEKDELNLDGVTIAPEDLDKLLSVDVEPWRGAMRRREEYLAQFDGLPDEIWEAHRRVAEPLDTDTD